MGQSLTIAGGICNSAVAICITIVVWFFLFALPSMTEVVAFPFYFVAFVCDVTQFTKAFPLSMVTGNLV